VLISAAKGVFLFLTRWIIIGISREIEFDLRNDLFRHLERQPAAYFQQHRTGDIMARMTNDLNAVRMLLGPAIMYSANTVLFSIGALYFLLRISPWLTLVALVPCPWPASWCRAWGARFMSASSAFRRCTRRFQRRPRRIFPAPGWSAPLPRKKPRLPPLKSPIRRISAAGSAWFSSWACSGPRSSLCSDSPMAITLLVGGHEVLSHRISIGDFVAFNTYMVMLTWPVIALGWVVNLWQRGTASVVRIDELLSDKPTIDDAAADPSIPPI
jgi:ATP-binding cassette subfamily B multidrug efflux pump